MSEVPRIYDISLDEYRPITQQDVDRLVKINQTYSKLISFMDDLRNERRAICGLGPVKMVVCDPPPQAIGIEA